VTRARLLAAAAAVAAALALALALALFARARDDAGEARADASPWASFVVLHTNDVHGGVAPRRADLAGLRAEGDVGGVAALASFVARAREAAAKAGAEVLLLDAGDLWRGAPEGDLTRGDLVVDAMGRLRYDAVALGNHELDLGVENAARLARRAPFPWLSANVVDEATGRAPDWLRPSVVLERAGLRIGVVGLSPPETARLVVSEGTKGLRFLPEVEAAVAAASDLEGKADVLLFLSHLGPEREREVADAVPRAALVVGGHTHQRLLRPIPAGEGGRTWVVQAGTGLVYAGRVRLRVHRETKEVALDDYDLVALDPAKVGSDAETARLLARGAALVPALAALDARVGTLSAPLSKFGPPGASSPAGNAVADAIREHARTDVAFTNAGGVRVTLPKGAVTGRDLHLLFPFENTIVVGALTGRELRSLLETSASGFAVTPLEVSGIEATYRREPEASARRRATVVSLRIGGTPAEDDRAYRFATNSFLAGGGDAYAFLERVPVSDTGILVRDALLAWFRARPEVVPDLAARVRPAP
jgi:2',3'-cyclic-nucleotide 2'-phosphodiesterase (5'-nucleotidase family)